MPIAAKKICAKVGCQELVLKSGRCKVHSSELRATQDSRRERGQKRYGLSSWHKCIRPNQLAQYPLCHHCRNIGLITPANEVDHIDGNPWNDHPSNLMSLCKPCHSRKTVLEDGAFKQKGNNNAR